MKTYFAEDYWSWSGITYNYELDDVDVAWDYFISNIANIIDFMCPL